MSDNQNNSHNFSDDYNDIMKASEKTVIVDTQWSEKGDYFEKFSLYDDYTPVKTSGSTTFNNQI